MDFEQYANGLSPVKIAEELNRRGIPPPGIAYRRRGSGTPPSWCGSALHGNIKHGLGLLNNPLYNGELIWGRSRWEKDPDTKKKRRFLCAEQDWIRTPAEHLRIIDPALWAKVKARQAGISQESAAIQARLHPNARTGRGPKYLFSGLLTCGQCGHRFIIADPTRYACSGWKYRGLTVCNNTAMAPRSLVERLLLEAIQRDLFTKEGCERFEQQVAKRLRNAQQAQKPNRLATEQRLQAVEKDIANIMAAIKAGVLTPTTKTELEKAESTRTALLRTLKLSDAAGSKVSLFLPNAIGRFKAMVENLATVTQPQVDQARASLRMLLGKQILLHPTSDGRERFLTAEVSGDYAGLVRLVTGKNKCGGGQGS